MHLNNHLPNRKRRQCGTDLHVDSQCFNADNTHVQPEMLSVRYLDRIRPGSQVYAQSLYDCTNTSLSDAQESEIIAQLKVSLSSIFVEQILILTQAGLVSDEWTGFLKDCYIYKIGSGV